MPFFSKREPEEDVIKLALTLGTESNRATGAAGMKKPHGFALVQRRASALFGMGKSEAELGTELVAKLDKVIADWQTGEYTYTVDETTKQEVDCAEVVNAEPYIGGKRLAVLQALVGPVVANAIVQKAAASGSDAFVDNTDKLIDLVKMKIPYTFEKNPNAKPTTDLSSMAAESLEKVKIKGIDTELIDPLIQLYSALSVIKEKDENSAKRYLALNGTNIALSLNILLASNKINKYSSRNHDGLDPGITKAELQKIKDLAPALSDIQHRKGLEHR